MAILRATMCIFTSAESPALKVMLSLGVCVYIVKTTRAVSKMSCSGSVQWHEQLGLLCSPPSLRASCSVMSWGRQPKTSLSCCSGHIHLHGTEHERFSQSRTMVYAPRRCFGLNNTRSAQWHFWWCSVCAGSVISCMYLICRTEKQLIISSAVFGSSCCRGPCADVTVRGVLVCQKYQRRVAYSLCFGCVCLPRHKSQNQASFDTYCLKQHWKKLVLTRATIHCVFPTYLHLQEYNL